MYETAQPPDEILQDEGLNVPPTLLSLQDMVPVGAVGKLDVSVMTAVSCTWEPGDIAPALDVIAMATLDAMFDVKVDVPVLPE